MSLPSIASALCFVVPQVEDQTRAAVCAALQHVQCVHLAVLGLTVNPAKLVAIALVAGTQQSRPVGQARHPWQVPHQRLSATASPVRYASGLLTRGGTPSKIAPACALVAQPGSLHMSLLF